MENRLRWASGPGGEEYYGYDAGNRRIYQSKLTTPGTGAIDEYVTLWSVGKRAVRYKLNWTGTSSFVFQTDTLNVWFGGKPLKLGAETNVVVDRLGSVRRSAKDYFPYGEEKPATAGDREKYATYLHDAQTNLAYADQRYYATGAGRFMTVDPAGDGLNWYSYVGGDPVNFSDTMGLERGACQQSPRLGFDLEERCPPGYTWNATLDVDLIRTQLPQNAVNIVHPTLAWAKYMLQNPENGACNGLFSHSDWPVVVGGGAEVFNTPRGGYDPASILNDIVTNGNPSPGYPIRSAVVRSSVIDGSIAAVASFGATTLLLLNEDWFNGSTEASIRIHAEPEVRALGGVAGAATNYIYLGAALIHELGHIYNVVGRVGGDLIFGGSKILQDDKCDPTDPDSPACQRQRSNHLLVYNSCVAPMFGLPSQ